MFREVARGVLWLALPPFESVNVYLLGDVLVDAGMRFSGGRIAQALADRPLTRHVLTHCFGHGPPLYAAGQFERFAESCRG